MDSFKNRSSLADKKEAIGKIEALDLNKIDNIEIEKLLKIIFSGYSFTTQIGDFNWILYRGIKYLQKPMLYSELIYPPKDKTKINRANDIGEQIFYCTTNKKAVFYELATNPGDILVISTWISRQYLLLNHIGYTENNLKNLGANDLTPIFKKEIEKDNDEENQFIHDYLSKTFSQSISDPSVYKLTIAIARYLLGDIESYGLINNICFDGLFYPTIRFNANANNLALTRNSIDHGKLSFEKVEFIEVLAYKDNKYQYKIKDVAETCDGDLLVWNGLHHTWTVNDEDNDLYFIDGNAYNESGQICPHD